MSRYLAGSDCYRQTLNTTRARARTYAHALAELSVLDEHPIRSDPAERRQTSNSPNIESARSPSRGVTSRAAALSAAQYRRQTVQTRIALEIRGKSGEEEGGEKEGGLALNK